MLGTWATPAVREHWGPVLTSGQKLASYCLTEPGAGSDAAALKTRAERVVFVKALPKNPSGKLLKRELRKTLALD